MLCSTKSLATANLNVIKQTKLALTSNKPNNRVAAMRNFANNNPINYGSASLDLIVQTLKDKDSKVRLFSLIALSKMGNRFNPIVIDYKELLHPLLFNCLKDNNVEISRLAAESLSRIIGSNKALEENLLTLLSHSSNDKYRNDLIRAIAFDGIQSTLVQNQLIQEFIRANIQSKEMLALALTAKGNLPPQLLPALIKTVELPELFGSSLFVELIGQYGQRAKKYLPRLKAIRNMIIAEQNKESSQRTFKIYLEYTGQPYTETHTFLVLVKTINELAAL